MFSNFDMYSIMASPFLKSKANLQSRLQGIFWKGVCIEIPLRIQMFGLVLSFRNLIPADALRGVLIFAVCFRFVNNIIVLKSIIFDLYSKGLLRDYMVANNLCKFVLEFTWTNMLILRTNSLDLMLQKFQSQASLRNLEKHWTTSWWKLGTLP